MYQPHNLNKADQHHHRGRYKANNKVTGRTLQQLQQQGSHTRSYKKTRLQWVKRATLNALAMKRAGYTCGTA
jgi:hypothetical protein